MLRHLLIAAMGVVVTLNACQCGPTTGSNDGGTEPTDGGNSGDGGTTDAGNRPRTVLAAIHTGVSETVTDPSGQRSVALGELLGSLPNDTRVLVAVFGGNRTSVLTSGIEPLSALTAARRSDILAQVLQPLDAGDSTTQHVLALNTIAEVLAHDDGGVGSRYDVVMLSNGAPASEEQELMCGAVVDDLKRVAKISTVLLFSAPTPNCTDPITVAACGVTVAGTTCTSALVRASGERLKKVADRTGGTFGQFLGGAVPHFVLPP